MEHKLVAAHQHLFGESWGGRRGNDVSGGRRGQKEKMIYPGGDRECQNAKQLDCSMHLRSCNTHLRFPSFSSSLDRSRHTKKGILSTPVSNARTKSRLSHKREREGKKVTIENSNFIQSGEDEEEGEHRKLLDTHLNCRGNPILPTSGEKGGAALKKINKMSLFSPGDRGRKNVCFLAPSVLKSPFRPREEGFKVLSVP